MSHDESLLPAAANAYLDRTTRLPYPVMERVEREVRDEGRPAVGRASGALLCALAAARGARRALEVGTNLGYSGLWIAAGLAPGGRFEGIEIDPALARRAEANLAAASHVERAVHVGAALDVLPKLADASYDLVFIDAVKAEYPRYLDHALRVIAPGGVIAADNMFWRGAVWDAAERDADTEGVREYTRRVTTDPRLRTAIVPVEDGMAVSVLAHRQGP